MREKRFSLTGVMLIVGIVIFVVYLYTVGFWDVVAVIAALDVRIALSTVVIDLLCISLFVYSWYILMGRRVRFRSCYGIILVSIFGDLMIPTASFSGEVLRISMTCKKGMNVSECTASVLFHRLLHGLTFGVVVGVSLIFLTLTQAMQFATLSLFVTFSVATLAVGIIGAYAIFNIWKFQGVVEKILLRGERIFRRFRKNYNSEETRRKIIDGFISFDQTVMSVRGTTIATASAALTMRWFLVALIPYLMFISLGHPVSYWIVLIVSIVVSMVQMIPIGIPGLVGVIELSMTTAFIGFGVPAGIAASATILTRLVLFWFELLLSAAVASYQGIKSIPRRDRRKLCEAEGAGGGELLSKLETGEADKKEPA